MSLNFSCKDCENRYVGCHSECEVYKKEKEKHNKKMQKIKELKTKVHSNHTSQKTLTGRMRKH